jgi:membrane fusion protein (multidrug efflux system)
VKKGDVILKLDDGDYRNALATAQSRVATMDDTLARIDAQIMAAQAAVEQAKAGLQGAQAALTNAERTSERTQQLAKGNVVSQATLDSAAEGLETARANVTAGQAAVASAEANVSVLRAQRAEAAGQKRELELAAQQAQRDLDKTVLRAPADGILANTAFEIGDLVSPGARLAALVPDNGIYIEANYKETELSGIAAGTEADVTIDAIPDRTFHGVVTSTAPATGSVFSLLPAENATGNFTKVVQRVPVRISLTDADGAAAQLRAGLSAVVDLDTRTTPGAGAGE